MACCPAPSVSPSHSLLNRLLSLSIPFCLLLWQLQYIVLFWGVNLGEPLLTWGLFPLLGRGWTWTLLHPTVVSLTVSYSPFLRNPK